LAVIFVQAAMFILKKNNIFFYFKNIYYMSSETEHTKVDKIYFSYSLYGTEKMYTEGMIVNAKVLFSKFPNAVIQIYVADDVPPDIVSRLLLVPTVKIVNVERKIGIKNMFDRFKTIDEPDCSIMIVRDADSRPYERDSSCIEDFINSDKLLHIVRDHGEHGTPILGGLWAIRKSGLWKPMSPMIDQYIEHIGDFHRGVDQFFLRDIIYPELKSRALIQDRVGFYGESEALTPFRVPIIEKHFCGQVYLFNDSGEEYPECNP